MLTGRIANLSPLPRTTWVQLAFPKAVTATVPAEAEFVTSGSQRCRAVRGADRGRISTIYRVQIALDGSERVEGELRPSSTPAPAFAAHPWVTDDLEGLMPTLAFQLNDGGQWETFAARATELVASSPAHQRWRVWGIHANGLRLEWFADLHHDEPVVTCWGAITWSSRTDPTHDFRLAGAILMSREMFVPDFCVRLGFQAPSRAGSDWVVSLGPLAFVDGSGIPLTGAMLATPQQAELVAATAEPSISETGPIGSIISALYGPAVGAGLGFDSDWLGTGSVPRLLWRQAAINDADADWSRFVDLLRTPGTVLGPRPLGCTFSPGQTGDQEDFGCVKGTHVVGAAGDPRHVYAYRYSVLADLFRGVMHRETDGSMLTAAAHPNWTTWTGYTHSPHSSDRIGKTSIAWGDRRATGWSGYDEQHRSQNNLAAYAALCDDPLADLLIAHHVETDLAGHRYRFSGADAMRGQGRPLLAWHSLRAVSTGDVEAKLGLLVAKRLEVGAREIMTNGGGPVRTIGTTGPDPRKPIYEPGTTELAETVSLWEMGLALVGFATAIDHVATLGMSRTIIDYGVFQEAGQWPLVADMLFRGGLGPTRPLSLALGAGADKEIILAAGSGVGNWVIPGIMVAVRALSTSTDAADIARVAKGKAALLHHTGGQEADSRRTAEWWAVVPSITSVTTV